MSNFADAIMQSMIASMDPNVAMQRDAMQGYLAQQQNVLVLEKGRTVTQINELLDKAIKSQADEAVISTYRKLLATLVD